MIQLIIEAVKPIADAVANSNKNDTLEILSKVNQFYDSAWNKLIFLLAGTFTLLSIIVPIIIQYFQNKTLEANEKRLEIKMNSKIEEIKKEIEEEINNKFKEKFDEFDLKIDKSRKASIAQSHHVQGIFHSQERNHKQALKDFTNASTNYAHCEDYFNLKRTLENISLCLDDLKKEDLEDLKNLDNMDLTTIVKDIEKQMNNRALLDFTKEIKTKVFKLTRPTE